MTGYTGELPPKAFNMARYCLGASRIRPPEKVALRVVRSLDGELADEVWTYGGLETAILSIAAGLRSLNLAKGSRVFIRMGNSVDYALYFFGAIAAGLVPIPASSQLSADEVGFILNDSETAVLIHSGNLSLPPLPPGIRCLGPDEAQALRNFPPGGYDDTHADDPAFLIYTSGTSGRPKGVLHAQRVVWGRRPMYEGWYGLTHNDVVLHTGAFNWTYTLGVGMFDPWANGASTVLYTGERDISVWPHLMATSGATFFASVPTLYRQLLKYGDITTDTVATLRHGLVAGEPLPRPVAEEWHRRTGLGLYEALGMSEVSTYISSSPSVPVRAGSPGRAQPGRCVGILPAEDDSTTPCEPGTTGLVCVHRSDPGLMLGYWNRPEEDAIVYRGDWFCGGDMGFMDDDGYIWFEGRNDDVMNAMGYRVSPVEVENVLIQHAAVAEVAVTDVQVRPDVTIIAAFVVTADGAPDVDDDALLSFAGEHLAGYKLPRAVYRVDALPRTGNGKVKRRDLAALVAPAGTRSNTGS